MHRGEHFPVPKVLTCAPLLAGMDICSLDGSDWSECHRIILYMDMAICI